MTRPGLFAYRVRPAAMLDVTGADRAAFLQGQITQDVRRAEAGEVVPAAGLTPKGKLLFVARLIGLPDRLRLLLPAASRETVAAHLAKYAVFQRVAIEDRSWDFARIGIVGGPPAAPNAPDGWLSLPGEYEFSSELLVPTADRDEACRRLEDAGAFSSDEGSAEVLRVEAGRPRFGQDANETNLVDEVGLADAISTTKGCYVGQEIVARLRTYGRVNRRLVGFRFPEAALAPGTILKRADGPDFPEGGKIEMGRVTSAVVSPTFGAIGLGFAFRDVAAGDRLVSAVSPGLSAIPSSLPFA
ncbi:MAG: hypothetical protein M3S32_11780 [Acidobacteriota bacterium]|nr:hypothetical protein [Acidobacteriota bacterium]